VSAGCRIYRCFAWVLSVGVRLWDLRRGWFPFLRRGLAVPRADFCLLNLSLWEDPRRDPLLLALGFGMRNRVQVIQDWGMID
jgi:hypothetical protein